MKIIPFTDASDEKENGDHQKPKPLFPPPLPATGLVLRPPPPFSSLASGETCADRRRQSWEEGRREGKCDRSYFSFPANLRVERKRHFSRKRPKATAMTTFPFLPRGIALFPPADFFPHDSSSSSSSSSGRDAGGCCCAARFPPPLIKGEILHRLLPSQYRDRWRRRLLGMALLSPSPFSFAPP